MKINKVSFTRDIGYGTGVPTTDTIFYFKVSPEYFANANKIKLTYSTEKEIKEVRHWEMFARLELVSRSLGLSIENSYKKAIDLLVSRDEKSNKIYDSIKTITKEEYDEL